MTPQEYDDLRRLFFEVSDLAPERRREFLDKRCGRNTELRSRVIELLEDEGHSTAMLRRAMLDEGDGSGDSGLSHLTESIQNGQTVGDYTIVTRIGRGGMGVVYEARQSTPERTVALKIISPGVVSDATGKRFLREADALARLQHPGIAQIFDARVADFGHGPQACLAMEFVRGPTLLAYADLQALSLQDRLRLFVRVGEAVHHAHQKGVIHRDLKPENILVDDQGHPKVVDFGVARLQESDEVRATGDTDVGQVVGTMPYMSPEQATGRTYDVDVRSDVYSLGVILYQLLANRLPHKVEGLMLHEAVRMIDEDEPQRLGSIHPAMKGDLDAIVCKALAKSPQARYQSALDLTSDIQRFLDHEPVSARTPSAVYYLRKYALRHEAACAVGALAVLMLILGVIGTSFGLYRARQRERDAVLAHAATEKALRQAEAARDEAEALTDYLQFMLSSVEPDRLGRDVLVKDVLDRTAEMVGVRFADRPTLEARIRRIIGVSYQELGVLDEAENHFRRALDIRLELFPEYHTDVLLSRNDLASVNHARGRHTEASAMAEAALEQRRSVDGADHPDTLATANNLAAMWKDLGRLTDAEALAVDTLNRQRRVLGEREAATLTTANTLAHIHWSMGRYDQALAEFEKNLPALRMALGREHPHTLSAMSNLATCYVNVGRSADAVPLLTDALDTQQRVQGETHPATLYTMNNLGTAYWFLAEYDLAEEYLVRARRIRADTLSPTHMSTVNSMSNVAWLYLTTDRVAKAEPLLLQALERQRSELGEDHPHTLRTLATLGTLRLRQGEASEAESLCQSALTGSRRMLGPRHPQTLGVMVTLARAWAALGRDNAAGKLFQSACEVTSRALPRHHFVRGYALSCFGEWLLDETRYGQAEKMLLEAFAVQSEGLGSAHRSLRYTLRYLIELYEAMHKEDGSAGFDREAAKWRAKLEATGVGDSADLSR